MTDDPRRQLEEAGRRPAPAPDPAFADRLEARLLAVAQTATPPPEPHAPRPSRDKRRQWLALAGLAVGALVLVVVFATGAPGGSPRSEPELAAPVNVKVALSDGTELEIHDGLRLPEGAVVTVGVGGFARIGDTVLRPGDVATIEHGRVNVEHDQPVGEASGTSTATPRATPKATPRGSQAPGRTPKPTAQPTPKATPKPTSAPDRTPRPTATPTAPPATPAPTPSETPTAEPTPSPTAPAQHLTWRPKLRAHANPAGNRVLVRWTPTRRAASYVLIVTRSRVGPAPDPVYPGSPVFRRFDAAPERWIRFRVHGPGRRGQGHGRGPRQGRPRGVPQPDRGHPHRRRGRRGGRGPARRPLTARRRRPAA